ncbi:MAG: OmpA family protein [Chitinophagaceae bacterium]|nr:OmpA family protein [Chitinophagaceae bacterium]
MSRPVFFFIILALISSYQCFAQPTARFVVYFDSDKSLIRKDAEESLLRLLHSTQPPAKVSRIEIAAHCDGRGSDQYNQELSLRRASAIEDYLRSNGLDAGIAVTKQPMGETVLLNADQTTTEQAMNRRAEIILHVSPAPLPVAAPAPAEEKESNAADIIPAPKEDSVIFNVFDPAKYDSIKVGDQLVVKNINFQPGRHVLIEWSMPNLRELLQVMKDHPALKIEIQGHICCLFTGADGPDLDLGTNNLSEERAKTVYRFLIENGIKKSRLSYRGFGSSQKLYPSERTERERSLNRRVEIKIISK